MSTPTDLSAGPELDALVAMHVQGEAAMAKAVASSIARVIIRKALEPILEAVKAGRPLPPFPNVGGASN